MRNVEILEFMVTGYRSYQIIMNYTKSMFCIIKGSEKALFKKVLYFSTVLLYY